jgi:predicted ATPase/transcriptional regulator with XRE-family HTH domain
MTQQDLAERAGLSMEAVSTLERGTRMHPHRDTVSALAGALRLAPEREIFFRQSVGLADSSIQRQQIELLSASLSSGGHRWSQDHVSRVTSDDLTTFVGRTREIVELGELALASRVVTIVGAGGVGKTRLAIRLAETVADRFADGSCFVTFAPIGDGAFVERAISTSLQSSLGLGHTLESVSRILKSRHMLVILDNCEHVIEHVREIVAQIIEDCPKIRIIATSREALMITGERAFRLPSLSAPPLTPTSACDALRYESVELFADRAFAADRTFRLTDGNAADVSEICRRLDGIPFAIELAAARIIALSPRQIAKLLDQRFRLLTGGVARASRRHQTMVALIDWSYDLLGKQEQRYFESLSVFSGGFTLSAALAIADSRDEIATIDLLSSLVAKSLVVAELSGNEQRFSLLESSRHYARLKLLKRDDHESIAQLHAAFYATLAEDVDTEAASNSDQIHYALSISETGNWRAAMEWALEHEGDIGLGQRLAVARSVRRSLSPIEAFTWIRKAIELAGPATPSAIVGRLEHSKSQAAAQLGNHEPALAAALRAVSYFSDAGNVHGRVDAMALAAGSLALLQRPTEALSILQEALSIARDLDDQRLMANVLLRMGWAFSIARDFASARIHIAESIRLATAAGSEFLSASAMAALAENEFESGNSESALSVTVELLKTLRGFNARATAPGLAKTLANMSTYLIAVRRYEEAQSHADEAVRLAHELALTALVPLCLKCLALSTLLKRSAQGRRTAVQYACAARVLGFANTRLAINLPSNESFLREYDSVVALLECTIGLAQTNDLMRLGGDMSEEEAILQARAINQSAIPA